MKYSPGKCNIGRSEIERRYIIGFLGLVFSMLIVGSLTTAVLVYSVPFKSMGTVWIGVLILPMFICYEGFFQGYARF